MLKRITFLLVSLCVLMSARGADVILAWDASATAGVTNYVLYAGTNAPLAVTNYLVRLSVGTNRMAIAESVLPGRWRFMATAIKDGIQSDPSNEVIVDVPRPPVNMRTVAIQYGATVTNFSDTGFFRLRIVP